ncbi:MAG: ABC transporter permease [Ancalomicrobiaceae bacterium]|nr:ABC transporter permease [Ancalomicrobiaceae bacterium]
MKLSFGLLRGTGSLIALVLIVIVFSVTSPVFLELNNLMNIIVQVAVISVIAAGAMFIILTGGIDLSVGGMVALAGVVSASVVRSSGSPALAIVVCLGVALMFGILAGALITYGKIPPFVCTLGIMSVARGLAFVYSGGIPISNFPAAFRFAGAGSIAGVPMMVIIPIVVYAALWVVLNRTPFGKIVYAIGSNEEATQLTGINTRKYKIIVYALAGLLTGLGALMYIGRINSGHPNSALGYELDAIAAVVIGGTSLSGGRGSIVGTIIGALIMGVIGNGLNLLNIDPYYQSVVLGTVIVLAVMIDQNSKNQRA